MRVVRPTGLQYLELVTDLLQRIRVRDPYAGLWEAADLQWWYPRDPHRDDADAVVWLGEGDVPVTAAVFTRWSAGMYGCDVLGDPTIDDAWTFVRERCDELVEKEIQMHVDPDCKVARAEASRAGFTEPGGTYVTTWLHAADRAAPRALPPGYSLLSRPQQSGSHPMAGRNGPDVEARLKQCSLYDPELDLALVSPAGDVAGYAMFWADQRTRVGLVEPLRIEDAHAGHGLAGTVVRAGLELLAERGCDRMKVNHEDHNLPAGHVYASAGFRPRHRAVLFRRRPPTRP